MIITKKDHRTGKISVLEAESIDAYRRGEFKDISTQEQTQTKGGIPKIYLYGTVALVAGLVGIKLIKGKRK